MNTADQNGHAIELRDEANRLVGYYVPVPVHTEIQRLREEIVKLRDDLAETKADRDRCRKMVFDMINEYLPPDDLDQLPLGSDGVPLNEVLREFESRPGA